MAIHLRYKDLGHSFGAHLLYTGLSGEVLPGQCTAIVGANGSGKSTLLRILGKQLQPVAGTVEYRRAGTLLSVGAVRGLVAAVTPELQFYEAMTAAENLRFFTGLVGKRLFTADLEGLSDRVQLDLRQDVPVAAYSTGMKQRLRLALLWLVERPVWLLDEPSSNLDAAGHEMVRCFIQAGRAAGHTILLATNEAEEAAYAEQHIRLEASPVDLS